MKKRKSRLLKLKADPNSKYWKKRADSLFSKIVRKVGKCQYCGGTKYLNCCHLIPKENWHTRWVLDNAICLDAGHHKFWRNWSFHHNPVAFFIWFIEKFPLRWKRLKELSEPLFTNRETAKEAYERLQKEAEKNGG